MTPNFRLSAGGILPNRTMS